MTKRIFVSIDLTSEIKNYLKNLRQSGTNWIKWMKPENLHITLNFLGNLDEREIREAEEILTETAHAFVRFTVKLEGIKSQHDMLWLTPSKTGELAVLQKDLKEKFDQKRLGKREKRQYHPHILVAKSKTGRKFTWQPKTFQPLELPVNKICLYESKLNPQGAIHTLIKSFPLNQNL